MTLSTAQFKVLMACSVVFCWIFTFAIAYTTLRSQDQLEIIFKGALAGVGIWCGMGLLKRKIEVLWVTIAMCLYAIYGSMFWLVGSYLLPFYNRQAMSFGIGEILTLIFAVLFVVYGISVVWFLLLRQTRQYLGE
jgi:hypothetical protein